MKSVLAIALLAGFVWGWLAWTPSPCAAWILDGVRVCTAPDNQDNPELASDGVGGAFYTWTDARGGEFDIYCQRVDAHGTVLWATDGIAVCTSDEAQVLPQIMADGVGGAFITWQGFRDYERDIHAQRIDADGTVLWTEGGVVVCDAAEHQGWHVLVPDGSGGVIIAWEDARHDHNDIYAQRVDADGNTLWIDNGVVIAAEESAQQSPRMISDGQGGAIVVWSDARFADVNVFAQRFNGDGTTLWTGGGVPVCIAEEEQRNPRIATDGQGGAIITWYDQRGLGDVYIHAQRVAAGGNALWATDGVAIAPAQNDQTFAEIVSDDAGGAIVTWNQGFPGGNTIYAQRVNADGTSLWTSSGIAVGGDTGNVNHPRIIPDGQGGAVIAWEDFQAGDWSDVHAQRLDSNGTGLWESGGLPICTALWDQAAIRMARGGNGQVIFTWEDARQDAQLDIYTSLVAADGDLVPTYMQDFYAWFDDGAVNIEWRTTEPEPAARFTIRRRIDGEENGWEYLAARIGFEGTVYSIRDFDVVPGRAYRYRIGIDGEGSGRSLFETAEIRVPESSTVPLTSFPNPCNPLTTVRFTLDRRQRVSLSVHDLAGRRIVQLADAVLPAGSHRLDWNGRDAAGREMGSGVYLLHLVTEGRIESGRITLVR